MKILKNIIPVSRSLGVGLLSILVLLSQANLFAGCGVSKVAPVEKTKFAKVAPIECDEQNIEAVSEQFEDLFLEDIEGKEEVQIEEVGFNDLPLEVICEIVDKIEKKEDVIAFACVSQSCFFASRMCNKKYIPAWIFELARSCRSDIFFRKEIAAKIFLWLADKNCHLLIREFLNKYKNNNIALKDAFSDSFCFYRALTKAVRKNEFELVKILTSNPEVIEMFLNPNSLNCVGPDYGVGPGKFFQNIAGESRYEIIELLLKNKRFFDLLTERNFRKALSHIPDLNFELKKLLEMAIKLKTEPGWREKAVAQFAGKKRK